MERKDVECLKAKVAPILEWGRKCFGKDVYDNHIIEILRYFDINPEDEETKEIFDL